MAGPWSGFAKVCEVVRPGEHGEPGGADGADVMVLRWVLRCPDLGDRALLARGVEDMRAVSLAKLGSAAMSASWASVESQPVLTTGSTDRSGGWAGADAGAAGQWRPRVAFGALAVG